MKKIKCVLSLLLMSIASFAAGTEDASLVFTMTSGEKQSYAFVEHLSLDFDNEFAYVTLGNDTVTSLIRKDIKSFGFEKIVREQESLLPITINHSDTIIVVPGDGEVSISSLEKKHDFSFVQLSSSAYRIDGVSPYSSVRIYSIDGKAMPFLAKHADASVVVELSNLPQGIYIIKVENKSIKVRKK